MRASSRPGVNTERSPGLYRNVPCPVCGENMPLAYPDRPCTDCDGHVHVGAGNPNGRVETAEKQYHGGRFTRGEW